MRSTPIIQVLLLFMKLFCCPAFLLCLAFASAHLWFFFPFFIRQSTLAINYGKKTNNKSVDERSRRGEKDVFGCSGELNAGCIAGCILEKMRTVKPDAACIVKVCKIVGQIKENATGALLRGQIS